MAPLGVAVVGLGWWGRTIVGLMFLGFYSDALAQTFEIVEGDFRPVCVAYHAYLESLDDAAGALICDRASRSALSKDVKIPGSRELDIYDHQDLFESILLYLKSYTGRNAEDFKAIVNRERGFARLREFAPAIDIDNDGAPDRVAVYRDGRCRVADGTSRNYHTLVLVLREDGKSVDAARTDRLRYSAKRRHSTMQPFLHGRTTYVDFWPSAEAYKDRDNLYVFTMRKNQSARVCTYRYVGRYSNSNSTLLR
jgi:hypothetical protein